jgi:hypothetical protein
MMETLLQRTGRARTVVADADADREVEQPSVSPAPETPEPALEDRQRRATLVVKEAAHRLALGRRFVAGET